MRKYAIKEIFGPTLQGEGSFAGSVVMFLRFAGCNKWSGREEDRKNSSCPFCDTDFVGGTHLTAREIIAELKNLGPYGTLVLSGGEPTLQLDNDLLSYLKHNGYKLHLETNGSRALGALHQYIDHITLSPKQPPEQTRLEGCSDLKLLYPYIGDGMSISDWMNYPAKNRFLQPVHDGELTEKNTSETIYKILANPQWKLSLQQHKILNLQ